MIDKVTKEIKEDIVVDEPDYNDTTMAHDKFTIEMQRVADLHDLELCDEQLAAVSIPNSEDTLRLYAWLSRYIEYSSDSWPSRTGDIHIPNLDKKAVWREYRNDMSRFYHSYLEYRTFLVDWLILFPNVKKKPMYGVMGHCEMCSMLTDIRNKATDPRVLER